MALDALVLRMYKLLVKKGVRTFCKGPGEALPEEQLMTA